MIDLGTGLRHMAWANQALFAHLATLPGEALSARYVPDAWSVGRLSVHLLGSADWYRFCLTGAPWRDLDRDWTREAILGVGDELAEVDATLLAEAARPDGTVTFEDEEGAKSFLRSTILTQAVVHAAEHRAQVGVALEVSGFPKLDLDPIDVWAFEVQERA